MVSFTGELIVVEIERQILRQALCTGNFLRGKKSLVKSTQSLSPGHPHTHTHTHTHTYIHFFYFLSQSVFAEMLQVSKSPQHLHQRENKSWSKFAKR